MAIAFKLNEKDQEASETNLLFKSSLEYARMSYCQMDLIAFKLEECLMSDELAKTVQMDFRLRETMLALLVQAFAFSQKVHLQKVSSIAMSNQTYLEIKAMVNLQRIVLRDDLLKFLLHGFVLMRVLGVWLQFQFQVLSYQRIYQKVTQFLFIFQVEKRALEHFQSPFQVAFHFSFIILHEDQSLECQGLGTL